MPQRTSQHLNTHELPRRVRPRTGQPPPLVFASASLQAQVAHALQASLEVPRILEIFSEMTQAYVPHDGYAYDHTTLGLHCSGGRLSRHECSYHLVMDDQDLGEWRLQRGRRFREAELEQLEVLLGGLFYPLRNALLYHQAIESAQTDSLTGLHNRAALDRHLPRELASFQRDNRPLALLVVDLDHFKQINDQYGHSVGDDVLRAIAECLLAATRCSDMVFRAGGEEFVVLVHVNQEQQALDAAERIRAAIESCTHVRSTTPGFPMTASIGLAVATSNDTLRSLFDRADQAMYAAKHAGRNRVGIAAEPAVPPAQ